MAIKNNSFIGGIHGVGKTRACKIICQETKLKYLSASTLIKWEQLNGSQTHKGVSDINDTQKRLITAINHHSSKENKYLLDGHYCLLNNTRNIERIPSQVFKQINPLFLSVIIDDTQKIMNRLHERDGIQYDLKFLEKFQNAEIEYARELSQLLIVPLYVAKSNNLSPLINNLIKLL